MKKQLFFLCALAVVTAACNVEESELNTGLRLVTLTAGSDSPADSKTSYTDDGVFSWTANDKIAVYTDAEQFYPLSLTEGAGTKTGTFTGEIKGTLSDYAVYPYIENFTPEYEDGKLRVYLPNSYEWSEEANNPMVGKIDGDAPIEFKNLAGLLKLEIQDVPNGATKLLFYSGRQLTGYFEVQDLGTDTPYITAEENVDNDHVTFNFSELTETTTMVFYIPIPVGKEYYFSFDIQDKYGTLSSSTAINPNDINRNELLIISLTEETAGAEPAPEP